jgi:putative ABC transport system substrate-binding protein
VRERDVFPAFGRRAALAALLAAALPPRAFAAERAKRIGYLSGGGGTEEISSRLAALGWVEGRNLQFEVRLSPPASDPGALKAAAEELVRSRPDVLVAFTDRTDALAEATRTIPIVSGFHADPVGMGLARSLRHPGRNITGLSSGSRESAGAWLGLLRMLRPRLDRVVVIHSAQGEARMRRVAQSWREVAQPMGIDVRLGAAGTLADVARIFDALGDPAACAAFPLFGGMTTVSLPVALQKDVLALALRRRIATVGDAQAGALMDYDASFADPMGRLAAIIDKILRGADPAGIPFELPDLIVFVLNRATAKAIGAVITPEILLRATRVIE